MKVFVTSSCRYALGFLTFPVAEYTYTTFADGEVYITLNEDVHEEKVFVLAHILPDPHTVFELQLLLDVLRRNKAHIHLVLLYCAYARQDKPSDNEPFSAKIILDAVRTYCPEKTYIVHIHNPLLKRFLDFEDLILLDFFDPHLAWAEILVAPDEGAGRLVRLLAERVKKPYCIAKKHRDIHKQIDELIIKDCSVEGKKVLIIDDMIATGSTIVKAALALHKQKAQVIRVAATHGIFAGDAFSLLAESPIEKIYVTNTLTQNYNHQKIIVVDCFSMIENIIFSYGV